MITSSLVLLLTTCLLTAAKSSSYLISGISDTTQVSDDSIRHHLVCFRHHIYQSSFDVETCCSQLYLKGSIERNQVRYCRDHLAAVPSIELFGSVAPAYYLAIDSSVSSDTYHMQTRMNDKRLYRQHRRLQVVEDGEKETTFDGYKGVQAYSPFHLTGFMPSGLEHVENDERYLFPLFGIAEGSLSNEGGMHRSFEQMVHFSFVDSPESNKARYRVTLNATVLLPITESVFIDADDPMIVQYEKGFEDGFKCKTKFISTSTSSLDASITENECDLQFTSSEVIDIEQPSFASRQYVVVYHIAVLLEFDCSRHEGTDWFDLQIDYGTTLHIRYPSPILNETNSLVPILIQQPVLYSATADVQCLSPDCSGLKRKYILQTDATSSDLDKGKKWGIPQPIVINVAAGVQADYWWVTLVTMAAAVIGGIVVIGSMDSISQWY